MVILGPLICLGGAAGAVYGVMQVSMRSAMGAGVVACAGAALTAYAVRLIRNPDEKVQVSLCSNCGGHLPDSVNLKHCPHCMATWS